MIVNSSPLIIFSKINRLDLLIKTLKKVFISQEVYNEVVLNGIKINASDAFLIKDYVEKGLIEIKVLKDEWRNKSKMLQKIYSQLDYGEAETIALALQENEKTILIDERIAREIARLHGLKPYGSLRIILLAYKEKLINEEEVLGITNMMINLKFRIGAEVLNKFLEMFKKLKKWG